ncbi:glycine cleavage system protein H [Roseimicrobium sp. ORNL1]|uniref:glycine cleavage system protein H n=1 Tax=Roseimicrobium sp. ORNL1 TaxID=2711231 RepID=UPI0013E132C0|nr:glycine cleavage system protein H [Roseimicrobium sp. ORNL1]QIF00694.1 glycine cleavage system protein H [Roseimicrobium sp. ORNL1]
MPLTFVRFKHARFTARFPENYRYSRSHYWMAPVEGEEGLWRVGFTKFATRMLGELVEANFKVQVSDPIFPGDSIGSVEGFKAASDVLCVMEGSFAGMNDALNVDACIVKSDPYEVGWLYAAKGQPEEDSLDVHGYVALLQETIQRMADAGYGHDEDGAKEDE